MAGSMSNPFDYREIMAANVGYIDKTVDEVIAAHEARSGDTGRSSAAPTEAGAAPVRDSERAKLDELFARAAATRQDPDDPAE
jgi:hypothetical protein